MDGQHENIVPEVVQVGSDVVVIVAQGMGATPKGDARLSAMHLGFSCASGGHGLFVHYCWGLCSGWGVGGEGMYL